MKNKSGHIKSFFWICAYLVIIDIAINIILPYPKDPRDVSPSTIRQFFEYGRSVEGKLARMTRQVTSNSAPILAVGWLDGSVSDTKSEADAGAGKPIVTVYGMSHAVLLAEDMAKIDKSFKVRSVGAPGAVPTWAYAAYLFDKEKCHSDVVILGIMTRGVNLIATTSGTTNHFDAVYPYTYPRFFLAGGTLTYILPPFISYKGYLEYFYNSDKWASYVAWLKKYDKFYDPVLFRRTVFDKSSIFRMIRRAYAYSTRGKKEAEVYTDSKGFNTDSDEVKILRSVIVEFAHTATQNNSLPIIYIVNNIFMGDRLFEMLEPTLASHHILYLSSHNICPPNDPSFYLPDSHFIQSKNSELANAMLKMIRENITKKAATICATKPVESRR